ncbi:bifunctional DNA primase/polymerase [Pseudonocardia sp.]|uniref:bifunctional DNA primase/polymerase n=1 Tax=Pseudonocardia sp. TaxID=60912 RepID=UPI00262612AD|nr:bifunctional DNA primase/polymerase [Pseudonocardia sp.]
MTHTSTDHTTYRHADPQAPPDRLRPQPLAAAALRAVAAGWAVFPVRPRGKVPAVRGWEDAATLDPERILAWWAGAAWNIGVAAGRSGLLVIDLDVPATRPHAAAAAEAAGGCPFRDTGRNVADDADPVGVAEAVTGSAVLRRLAADAAVAPPWDTFTVATPSGGRHLYFRQPNGAGLRNTQNALGPLIDTRGHGVVAAVGVSRRTCVLIEALRGRPRRPRSSPACVSFPRAANAAGATVGGRRR